MHRDVWHNRDVPTQEWEDHCGDVALVVIGNFDRDGDWRRETQPCTITSTHVHPRVLWKVMPARLTAGVPFVSRKSWQDPCFSPLKWVWRCCSLESRPGMTFSPSSFRADSYNRARCLRPIVPLLRDCHCSVCDLNNSPLSSSRARVVHIPQPRTASNLPPKSCLLIHNCPNA